MREKFPSDKKIAPFIKGALAAIGLTAAATAVHEKVNSKEEVPIEHTESGRNEARQNEGGNPNAKEQIVANERAKELADFEESIERKGDGERVMYTDADRSILQEKQDNAFREYLRFNPKVESAIREHYGSTPLITSSSKNYYVVASGTLKSFFGVYAGRNAGKHLFDLGINLKDGAYEYRLLSVAPELGISEEK